MQITERLYTMFDFLLFGTISNEVGNVQKKISRFWFFISRHISIFSIQSEANNIKNDDDGETAFRGEEVEMVMDKLGIYCRQESDGKLKETMGFGELSKVFDEEEPSLVEIKESFDVFDQNRDGFIDAEELQRVTLLLGLRAGSDLQNCRKMIRNFDRNGDGRIDFKEFVKLMEFSLC